MPTDTLLPEFDHGRELGSFPWQIVVCTLHIVPREDALGLVVGKNTGGYDSLAPGNKLKGHAQASPDGDLPVHVSVTSFGITACFFSVESLTSSLAVAAMSLFRTDWLAAPAVSLSKASILFHLVSLVTVKGIGVALSSECIFALSSCGATHR